ncbi:trans-L-3-hydroxyproline dehydratase [Balamuthia mandrillaris]
MLPSPVRAAWTTAGRNGMTPFLLGRGTTAALCGGGGRSSSANVAGASLSGSCAWTKSRLRSRGYAATTTKSLTGSSHASSSPSASRSNVLGVPTPAYKEFLASLFSAPSAQFLGSSSPAAQPAITTLDMHTEGEPLRIVLSGLEELLPFDMKGTMLQRRRFVQQNLDHLRRCLMWEPRGHRDMYGCLLFSPERPDSDVGVLFLHNEGLSSMCGHGIIALTKAIVELRLAHSCSSLSSSSSSFQELRIDTPAGLVEAKAWLEDSKLASSSVSTSKQVKRVTFENVPSFAYRLDVPIWVPELAREVRVDIGWGGAFYAYVQEEQLWKGEEGGKPREASDYRLLGMAVKRAVMQQVELVHPFEQDLSFLYGTIIVGKGQAAGSHSKNVCIFADGEVDRCPTGTGVSGRLALHHAKKELSVGETIVIESILGTTFTGRVVKETQFGSFKAIIPEVGGRAFVTGFNKWVLDPEDPLRYGFILS